MSSKLDEVLTASVELLQALSNTDKDEIVPQYIRTVNTNVTLQDFKKNLEWFNTSKPLSLYEDLKGKVVVLDFFTYCCINCLHILPYLKELEESCSVKDGLVIVGVHSAKFNNEKDSENIISALQRYEVHHPVVNDAEGVMWNDLSIPCWPTLLVLGPSSEPLLLQVGESNIEQALRFIKASLKFFREEGRLSTCTLPVAPAAHLRPKRDSSLMFPGKVTACRHCRGVSCENIAVSDSGNHRVIVVSGSGEAQFVIGGTNKGFRDGSFAEAQFNSPQGLAFQSCQLLFVADTENHSIRRIDLATRRVTTVAGTGRQGYDMSGGGTWTGQALSSPWDLCLVPGMGPSAETENSVILVAVAGTHQIWALFLRDTMWWKQRFYKAGTCVAIVGTGKEENRNNSYPHAAAFAQPSGLALSPGLQALFVADSESSSVRRVSLVDGKVTAVAGGSRNPFDLFQFGDIDGKLFDAKLQHPLGVTWCSENETLYVTDSYNHKIKAICVSTNVCKTFAGSGKPGDTIGSVYDNAIEFSEPGGLCVSSDETRLYVADTNNHCIKVIHVKLNTVEKMDIQISTTPKKRSNEFKNIVQSKIIRMHPSGGAASLKLIVSLNEGLSLTPEAPQQWSLAFPGEEWPSNRLNGKYKPEVDIELKVPKAKESKSTSAIVMYRLYVCRDEKECMLKDFQFLLVLHYEDGAPTAVSDCFRYAVT